MHKLHCTNKTKKLKKFGLCRTYKRKKKDKERAGFRINNYIKVNVLKRAIIQLLLCNHFSFIQDWITIWTDYIDTKRRSNCRTFNKQRQTTKSFSAVRRQQQQVHTWESTKDYRTRQVIVAFQEHLCQGFSLLCLAASRGSLIAALRNSLGSG